MLARRAREGDVGDAGHKVGRFLFDGLAFVVFRSASYAVVTAEHASFGLLRSA